ncbi:MAG TPA: CsbD family protein [Thermoanaerobaculia bacterium]
MASGMEHRGKGILEQVKGAVKEGVGALTGDRKTEIEGKAGRAKGAVREAYGNLKSDLTEDDLSKPPK